MTTNATNTNTNTITITSAKGSVTGDRATVLAWLREMRPSFASVVCADGTHEEVDSLDLPASLDAALARAVVGAAVGETDETGTVRVTSAGEVYARRSENADWRCFGAVDAEAGLAELRMFLDYEDADFGVRPL